MAGGQAREGEEQRVSKMMRKKAGGRVREEEWKQRGRKEMRKSEFDQRKR